MMSFPPAELTGQTAPDPDTYREIGTGSGGRYSWFGTKPDNCTLARLGQVLCFHVKELRHPLVQQGLLNVNLHKFVVFFQLYLSRMPTIKKAA